MQYDSYVIAFRLPQVRAFQCKRTLECPRLKSLFITVLYASEIVRSSVK